MSNHDVVPVCPTGIATCLLDAGWPGDHEELMAAVDWLKQQNILDEKCLEGVEYEDLAGARRWPAKVGNDHSDSCVLNAIAHEFARYRSSGRDCCVYSPPSGASQCSLGVRCANLWQAKKRRKIAPPPCIIEGRENEG